jgi:hypothetical protein
MGTGTLSLGLKRPGMKLTTHLQLVLRSRKAYNWKHHNLYFLPYIVKAVNSRRVRMVGHGEVRNAYTVWSENQKKRSNLGHLGLGRKIILKWILTRG